MKYKIPSYIKDLGINRCFVCDAQLDSTNYTLEHLIPQWVIRQFGLDEHTISLTPTIKVPYLNLVVPCCRECNCELLSPYERRLSHFFKQPERVNANDEYLLYDLAVWSCKIFSGLRIFETVRGDQTTNCNEHNIEPDELCQLFLKMLRGSVRITHLMLDFPFSAFLFRTKLPRRKAERFDFQIVPDLSAMYLRLGAWSLLSRFDGGYLALYSREFFAPYRNRKLAPLQMEELAAHFFTMARRQAYPLLYTRSKEDGIETLEYIPVTVSRPFVDPGTDDDFLHYFSFLTRIPLKSLLIKNRPKTFLIDNNNHFLKIPADLKRRIGTNP